MNRSIVVEMYATWYWPWLKTPSSSIACHMPAACVLVCTITDRFINQSTSSLPNAHFRINLPETYEKRATERKKERERARRREKSTSNHYVIVFICGHIDLVIENDYRNNIRYGLLLSSLVALDYAAFFMDYCTFGIILIFASSPYTYMHVLWS